MSDSILPPHGGYRNLFSYQKAAIVFQGTVYFCNRFLDIRDRTRDQMIQAARSGKQNIVEGSQASGSSKEMELKLTCVARASLEELLEDFRDHLKIKGLVEWPTEHPYTARLRQLNREEDVDYETFRKAIEHKDDVICINALIGLTKLTTYLLDRQIEHLEKAFILEGGLRERMSRARRKKRGF